MNTKPLPAIVALIAGAFVSVISFIQQVDMVVFARRFILATILFLILGFIAKIVLDKNFKEEEPKTEEDDEEDEDQDTEDEESED